MKASQSRKKFLAFLLSTLMLTSTAMGFASCGDNSSSSSSSSDDTTTEEYVDTELLKNAGFENFDDNKGKHPIATAPNSWSIGKDSDTNGSAATSDSASGIVDTATSKWDTLTKVYVENAYSTLTEAQVADKWEDMSTRDKLEYYRDWKNDDDNDNRTISKLPFYESFNIDHDDLPIMQNDQDVWVGLDNPRTWDWTEDSETDEEYDSRVMMLHNSLEKTNYIGTAYKATSQSTITVKAGTSAKLSLWVKTAGLEGNLPANAGNTSLVDLGAYIQLTQTLGGATLDPVEVKNINTANVTDNNGWEQYTFYLQGSYFADTTFTVVLGLGHGGSQDRYEYVNGFAFFDDIKCETITNTAYGDATTTIPELSVSSKKENKVFDANNVASKTVAINYYGLDADFATHNLLEDASAWDIAPTTEKNVYGTRYTAVDKNAIDDTTNYDISDAVTYKGLGLSTTDDKTVIANSVKVLRDGNDYAKAVYNNTFIGPDGKDKTFLTNEKALILLSAHGANYTAKSPEFSISAEKGKNRVLLSFFVKTSAMHGFTGATITLNEGNNKHTFSSIDTTTLTATTVGKTEIYDGWQQCLFFLYNETDTDQKVSLTFNFGATNVIETTPSSYREGFAIFSGFKTKTLTKQEYSFSADTTYSKAITLSGKQSDGTGDSGFDTATNLQSYNIENGYAIPQNYVGVYSDSVMVNSANTSTDTNVKKASSGLLNKKYAKNYVENNILENLGAIKDLDATPEQKWNSVFGEPVTATQPLVIYNESAETKSYGFIGKTQTISANSYKAVSLRVKTSANAEASIYLIDMDDTSRSTSLSIGRNQTYWYDAKGNVCDMDPTDKKFDKTVNVAFKLQPNGLYKVNPDWTHASSVDADKYFANLLNYKADSDNNLLIAENGVSYNYSDLWQHEGNDGIAFYGYNKTTKTAFADKATTVPVYDFSLVTELTARYVKRDATQETANHFENIKTNGAWVEVNFFIHAGTQPKKYRLEVWSGTRDGNIVNKDKGDYVLFDINHYTIDATKFASNTELYKKDLAEENYFENVFSFYDSAKYLRYNEELDENKVGNKYTKYNATNTADYVTHKASIAYLRYTDNTKYEIYTDYALTDTDAKVDVIDDETPDNGTDDNTTATEANPLLLASSIAVSAVLIFAVVLIIVRKCIEAYRKKHGIHKK